MLICVLSADYLADSNAVFVLESGVQVDLRMITKCIITQFLSYFLWGKDFAVGSNIAHTTTVFFFK